VDNVAILEEDAGQGAANLSANLYLRDWRKLTEKAEACIDVLYQRPADHNVRQ
jgi:hypothetical protein